MNLRMYKWPDFGHVQARSGYILYRKILLINLGLIFVQIKGFFGGRIFAKAYFQRSLLLEGILHFKMGWA